jgi:hypothetical protein
MSLPVPNPDEVASFRLLYETTFKVKLTDAEALEVTTKALHFHYVKNYAMIKPEHLESPTD